MAHRAWISRWKRHDDEHVWLDSSRQKDDTPPKVYLWERSFPNQTASPTSDTARTGASARTFLFNIVHFWKLCNPQEGFVQNELRDIVAARLCGCRPIFHSLQQVLFAPQRQRSYSKLLGYGRAARALQRVSFRLPARKCYSGVMTNPDDLRPIDIGNPCIIYSFK